MKCDNCPNDAAYTHAEPGLSPAHYCVTCLPQWLHDRANSGHFPLMIPVVETTEAVVEEAVEEVKVVEEKPKKKAAAPKASSNEDNK